MADWDYLIDEVNEFLAINRDGYINCVKDLMLELNAIRHKPECSNLIYSIYSRGDRQYGEQLKKDWKIAKKLLEWRIANAKTQIFEIHDIIGGTIVVNFPSETETVADYLQRPGVLPTFAVYNRVERKEKGYHAVHLWVKCATMKHPIQKAEIQIKTMLHDGWSAKTHDLTHKPQGEVSEALDRHMQILGDVLSQLDVQSELIKDAILIQWNLDRRRREAARQSLLLRLIGSTDSDRNDKIVDLAKEIDSKRDLLSIAAFEHAEMCQIQERIAEIVGTDGYTRDVCRLLAFFASLRRGGELNAYALTAIENWYRACDANPVLQIRPITFRALSYYALGLFEEAAKAARFAVKFCEKHGLVDHVAVAKSNLAYFLSELAFAQPKRDPIVVEEALALSAEALTTVTATQVSAILDTRGAVLIACGETEHDVREGLRACQEAFEKAPDAKKPVSEAFFRLHERRAFRRLLEWD